jgi:ribosome-binding factor A
MSTHRSGSETKSKRPLRVAAEIKRDLPDLIRKHVALPHDVLVSITDVELSTDLSYARVFFSVLGKEEAALGLQVENLLNAKKSAIRTEIAHRLIMRQHPEIRFIYDTTPARAARIELLFKQIHEEEKKTEEGGTEK